jgi:hypothetical protein
MNDHKLTFCATDKEIYDVLISSAKKFSVNALLSLAKERGILYSTETPREDLVEQVALLPHDRYDLDHILDLRGHADRREKVTSVTLDASIPIADIKKIAADYKEKAPEDENVVVSTESPDLQKIKVDYTEVDFQKTRLIQRRTRHADIEIIRNQESVVVRFPANEKSKEIADKVVEKLKASKEEPVDEKRIELTLIGTHEDRSHFFTMLIDGLEGYTLYNVSRVKLDSSGAEAKGEDFDFADGDEVPESAEKDLAIAVRNAALKGETLLSTPEYNQLKKKGFYITSITWQSKQILEPQPLVEFEASFGDSVNGKDFKYNVRSISHYQGLSYRKSVSGIDRKKEQGLLSIVEQAAYKIIQKLVEESDEKPSQPPAEKKKPGKKK